MGFAKFLNERDDGLVARAESGQRREEKRVRQTLMCFATFPNEGDDDLVAGTESGQ